MSRPLVPENNHIRIPRLPGLCTGLLNRTYDAWCERRLNVRTNGKRAATAQDAARYEAINYYVCDRVFARVELQPGDVIADLGSGEGRVVFAAAQYPVAGVIGVELEPELDRVARLNAQRLRRSRAPVRLLCESATELDLREVTVLCLFNPFGAETMRQVVANLKRSLDANPREVRIIYVNAVCADVWVAQPWIEFVEQWKMSPWSRIKAPVHFYRAAPVPGAGR